MKFDFNTNTFIDLNHFNQKALIIGSDKMLTDVDVYALHLKLKSLILSLNIPEGHPVCIYGEKEALFPVVMITLISLNIPYVPIDAIMPSGRIEKIKEQTNSRVLINCSSKKCDVHFDFLIDKELKIKKSSSNFTFKTLYNTNDPIRYILFTSGSTGIPKGVQITKRALNSFVGWYLSWAGINSYSVFMNQAPFSFDVSLCDLIGCFGNNATMILNNYETLKNGTVFLDRIKKYCANTMVCTPAFIKMYVSIPEFNSINYPELTQFIFMGEELPAASVKKVKQAFPAIKVINAFGPTEATVVTTYIEITDDILLNYSKSLPIGYCRPNSEVIILNKDAQTGIGEIGLIGPNLSIGYLNDEEKTKQSFVTIEQKTVYKTGDVGFIKDNLIFYLGRNDNQVKLNGYRIELEEISNVLLTHPSIINATTIPLTTSGVTKKIISYIIISEDLIHLNYSEILKTYLLNHLPSYMIPSEFIAIKEFPLNSNYKIDKKILLNLYLNG